MSKKPKSEVANEAPTEDEADLFDTTGGVPMDEPSENVVASNALEDAGPLTGEDVVDRAVAPVDGEEGLMRFRVLTHGAIFDDSVEVVKGVKADEENPVVKRSVGDEVMLTPSVARAHRERGVALEIVQG